MRDFAALYDRLDSSTATGAKVHYLSEYFSTGDALDLAWSLYFLCGLKIKRVLTTTRLRQVCLALSGLPDWLFQECYDNVGDLAETIALLVPQGVKEAPESGSDSSTDLPFLPPLSQMVKAHLLTFKSLDDEELVARLSALYSGMTLKEKFVFNKLVTGGFRVGVSQKLVAKAIAKVCGLSEGTIQERMMGDWSPSAEFYQSLISAEGKTGVSTPYPFYLAHPLPIGTAPEDTGMGEAEDFVFEWKWDGIRAQVVKREGQIFIWSRGEELVSERFPEIMQAAAHLPDGTVLDGEILAFKEGDVLPFALLQKRIGRKTIGKKLMAEVPVAFMGFDILEAGGKDIRHEPYEDRRHKLMSLLTPGACQEPANCSGALSPYLRVSPTLSCKTWQEAARLRDDARTIKVEGLMLKRLGSAYGIGRKRGDWWKWKVDPYIVDAVLVYAQRGHGRRASLYTDYTFALWHEDKLVPVAKAYSGLTDNELKEVDAYVKANTLEKFGPVRTVRPGLVFELAFEGIQLSSRHKSGVAVRFPRINRRRFDKSIEEADKLSTLKEMAGEE